MPVYLFNIHGYKTWMPNHPRGYTRKNEGVYPPDEKMNQNYEERSHFDAIYFNDTRQRTIINSAKEVCANLSVRPYYLVCVTTHLHALVCWNDERTWEVIYDRIKRIIALKLARSENVSGRRWLAARRNGTRLETIEHLVHHMTQYLPDHHGHSYVDHAVAAWASKYGVKK